MLAMNQIQFQFDFSRMWRVLVIAAVLTVGSLQVTRCSNDDDDVSQALSDQHDRMHRIVLMVGGE